MVGDSGAGKSSIMWRYCENEFFSETTTTIGVDFKTKPIVLGNMRLKLNIWDTAGQERFRTLTSSYYRNAQAVILVYDVTVEKSFENLKTWLQEIEAYTTCPKIVKLLVGNKIDLNDRKISRSEAEKWARENGMMYLECSAKSSENIQQAFEEVVEKIFEVEELLEGTKPIKLGEGTVNIGDKKTQEEENICFC
jgi:Ras-related protein Rab-18